MKGQSRINSFLVLTIFIVVMLIFAAITIGYYDNRTPLENNGEEIIKGTIIDSSECLLDQDCVDQYGIGYTCFLKECYAPSTTATPDTSDNDNGGASEDILETTGFFSNFFTGNAVSEEAGDVIYYNDGYVGIGTSAPSQKLKVAGGNISADGFCIGSNCIGSWPSSETPTTGLWSEGTLGNIYYSTGNVGIGTASPGTKLDINGAIKLSGTENMILNGNYLSGDGEDEGVFVSSSGNVGIGKTNPQTKLDIAGTIWTDSRYEFLDNTPVGSTNLCVSGTTIGYCTSLKKYKEDVSSLNLGLKEIMKLKPVKFTWTKELGGQESMGFIAEEVEKISPLLAQYTLSPDKKSEKLSGVNYNLLSTVLTKAMQEQQAQIEEMQQSLCSLGATKWC